jgi:hypothetical protein
MKICLVFSWNSHCPDTFWNPPAIPQNTLAGYPGAAWRCCGQLSQQSLLPEPVMLQGGDLQKGGGLCLVLGTKFVMLSQKKKKKKKKEF